MSKKTQLNTFWQNVAYNFYPQRAFFTRTTSFPYGRDFAANLVTSYPILIARDLSNSISSYLRPRGQDWFKISVTNTKKDGNLDNESQRYLEWATQQQKSFLYDRNSGFVRATKEGDADYAVFGQCVISIERDMKTRSLLHRCWNMRDVAWDDAANGEINFVCREWKTTVSKAYEFFGDKLSKQALQRRNTNGDQSLTIFHIVMSTDDYNYSYSNTKPKTNLPYTSIFLQVEDQHEISCEGEPTIIYCIPRWQTVSGSQYAYSPAVVAALPDARLLQSITLSLLEAGEKAVNPPMIAKSDAVRDDISLIANTISWISESYEGAVDDAIKVMNLDRSGLQYGLQMQADTRAMMREAFFLNKLTLPVFNEKMTATEVRQRIQEWIRSAIPLFEPMETEYNKRMCEMQFQTLMHVGAFGTPNMIPEGIRGKEATFTFENPLIEAQGKERGQKFLELQGAIASAINLDPSVANIPNANIALRDTLEGIGIPAKWLRGEEEVEMINEAQAKAQQAQQYIQTLAAGGEAAELVGKGAQAIQQAGLSQ